MIGQLHKRYLLEDYRLEPEKQLLSQGERPVRLPKKPFQVLLHLIEHRDRYVSRAELLELFWEGHEVYDDALRKCIGTIRKALDDQSDTPRFVETRWGVGYRYIGPVEEQLVQEETTIVEIEKTRGVRIVVEEEEIQDETAITENATVNLTPAPALSLPPAPKRYTKMTALALIFLAVAIGAVVLLSYRRQPPAAEGARAPIRSIAVLPLRNLTNDPANEYLSDGITESLITALSRIEGLKVVSRGSVFVFKGKDVDPQEAGKKLGVAAVLEGSLRKSGDQIRVDVRLVNTEDGRVLWAGDSYDLNHEDALAVEDTIARQVVAGLRIKLTSEAEQQFAKRYTNDTEAYQAYLKGRYFREQRTAESLKKADEFFQRAVAKDPRFALAYAGLADNYINEIWCLWCGLPPSARAASQGERGGTEGGRA
jgi:TolB-like protein/DNA-binding winged helix-turn-helix (wHTH) protein